MKKAHVPIISPDRRELAGIIGRAELTKFHTGEIVVKGVFFPESSEHFGEPIVKFDIKIPEEFLKGS
jgi:hypothetical protein